MVKESACQAGNARVTGSISGSGRPLEAEMATYFSFLAWEIPWTEEPGLQSMETQRVRHNLATKPMYICQCMFLKQHKFNT